MGGADEVNCRDREKVSRSPTKKQYKDTKQKNRHERTPFFAGFESRGEGGLSSSLKVQLDQMGTAAKSGYWLSFLVGMG